MIKITNLNEVQATSEKVREYEFEAFNNNYKFSITRVKNDINGNPMYKVTYLDNKCKYAKGIMGRTYINKNYTVFQSYNLENSLMHLFRGIAGVKIEAER